ncbi:hypothetical protein VP01_1368g4, partial [Puccinia sorghi]
KQHNVLKAPGLEPNLQEDTDGFTCHLSLGSWHSFLHSA